MGENKKRKKKRKLEAITFKKCRKIKRVDGLEMQTVQGYTFPDFIKAITSRYHDRIAYRVFRTGEENDLTYDQLGWEAYAVSTYLLNHGIGKGDKVMILGESCPNWMVMYLGITCIGAIAVPVLPDFSSSEVHNIIKEAEPKAICVNTKHFPKVKDADVSLFLRMEDLVHVTDLDKYPFTDAPGFSAAHQKIDFKRVSAQEVKEDDVASLIFTSGTTGSSKGVLLTHLNLLRNADISAVIYVRIKPGMRALSILPMSHAYEFTLGHCLMLMLGMEITFLGRPPATSILMAALSEVRPHAMLSVPLLIEKVYKAAIKPALEAENVQKLLRYPLTAKVVYHTMGKKLMSTFGNCMRFFGIGGAAIDDEVVGLLHKIHFPYALGYGLTETSPLIAACGSSHRRQHPGYVGEIHPDSDVKLLEMNEEGIGEIAVKGCNVMKGYYKNPGLNDESFTEDGYFKTGDLGYVDRKRHLLAIKGRVKTMILGPGGENIYPEPIESLINANEYVEESLVIPDKGGLVALIKIDLALMSKKMKISMQEAHEEALKYVKRIKTDVNSELSAFSKLSDVELQEEAFERTPTQKIKRFLYERRQGDKGK